MIFLAIYIVLALLCYFNGKSKVLFLCLCGLLFIITVHTQFGNDINNIRDSYETPLLVDTTERSAVFYPLIFFLGQNGISFYEFRILQYLFWLIPTALFVRKFSLYPALVFVCCFLFPLVGFGAQIRNGIMVGFIYWGLLALFSIKGKWGKVLYILSILIASLFHYLAFVYLIVLFAFFPIKTSKLRKYSVVLCIITFALIKSGQLFGFIASNIGDYYADGYFASTGNIDFLFAVLSVGLIVNCLLSYRYSFHILTHKNCFSQELITFAELTPRINSLMLVLLPLLLLSGSFYRIFQNIFILTVILAFNASRIPRANSLSAKIEYLVFYFFIAAFYIYWQGEFLSVFRNIVL